MRYLEAIYIRLQLPIEPTGIEMDWQTDMRMQAALPIEPTGIEIEVTFTTSKKANNFQLNLLELK